MARGGIPPPALNEMARGGDPQEDLTGAQDFRH